MPSDSFDGDDTCFFLAEKIWDEMSYFDLKNFICSVKKRSLGI